MIPASEELLATLDMACGCVSERTFPEAGLAHLMDDGLVTCPEHGWTTLTSLSDVEVVKVAPRGEYKRLFLACRCHYYEDGRVDPGDLVVCPDHGEQRVVAARSGRGEPRPNRGIFWPDAHRWRPEDEAAMNETGEHPLLPPSGRDLAGLLLSWLRERDSDWGEIAKWRSKLGHIFPPVEHWLLRMAGALRHGRGFSDPEIDRPIRALGPVGTREKAEEVVALCRQAAERETRTRIFGDSWLTGTEHPRVAVPEGASCPGCGKRIREWQRGLVIPTLDLSRDEIWHVNCRVEQGAGANWITRRVRGGGREPDQCPSCGAEWRPHEGGLISESGGRSWRCHVCDHRWPAGG
jgi:hypothetical protein